MSNTTLVPGSNWIGYKFDGGVWKPYACARSGSVTIDTDTVETSAPGTGDWKTFEPTAHSVTASLDGVVSLNNAGNITLPDLQASQIAKEKMLWRFIQTSMGGDTYIKECYFYITNSTDTGSFDGIATFQISLRGTGAVTQIFTPPSPTTGEVFRYPAMGDTAPATPGAVTMTATGLAGKTILEVVKNGQGSNNIILSGTPVNQEVLYEDNGADGDFTWALPFADGETFYILYQNN